jgi:hypothetical protein
VAESEDVMRNLDELAAAMGSIRDQVLAVVREHEEAAHGGHPCWLERCGALAYLAHCLGVGVDRMQTVAQMTFDCDVRCVENGGCAMHPGEPVHD